MPQTAGTAISKLLTILKGDAGLSNSLATLTSGQTGTATFGVDQIVTMHAASEVVERALGGKYPNYLVYVEKLENSLNEKFRTFSGKARTIIEVRTTHHHLDEVSSQLETYVEAALLTLENQRGDWGDGVFYSGNYDVQFNPVKKGGEHFLQTAKISFDLHMSY